MFFYCKMCGGELEVNQDATVGQCQYCGTKQTIPKTDNEKIMNLFNRANHYRMKNDFDNAMNSYENILNEDSKNAEAYWGLCLCRYGIEYVKDPLTEKMIPTCHRTQLESIIEDEDFISACENADSVARSTYEQEAKHIDKIQKKILQISSKEEDYDVFICYKEADNMGERTPDSVIGQDIYDALTEKGIRVFFARISLEDKVGTAYEPYIFAALQSAPIMITIGTKPEYMEAVWVKNEWSRFLAMMKKDSKKTIIPVYKFMNPYDMPEGFARIQAVNMEKIGAMQDLVHGIEKILGKDKNRIVEKVVRVDENANSASKYAPLLERAWIFLEDKNWNKAREYVERVLDMNPKCGEAYLIKMLAGMSLNNRNALKNWSHPLDGRDIRTLNMEELRKNIALVLQDTHLFTGTVMENIRYGRLDASDEEVIAAAKTANADYFIRHLSEGYDTVLEGDGSNLSQGQRQLLNIARAALSKAPVLIMDEATSSVDTITERQIQDGMDRLMSDRTTFVIAHRLSTIRNADAIMVLENGEIIERGTHEQLLAMKGRYYELYTGKAELD